MYFPSFLVLEVFLLVLQESQGDGASHEGEDGIASVSLCGLLSGGAVGAWSCGD